MKNAKRPDKAAVSLAKLDIGMLSSLDALLSERSVTRAARKLGLAQPSMSNALSRLRATFGDPLIVRTSGEMELTRRAEAMLPRVRSILQEIELLNMQVGFDPQTSTASFHIAATDHASLVLMPQIIAEVYKEAPKVRLMTSSLDRHQQGTPSTLVSEPHLRMHWVRSAPPDWHARKLLDETMVVIGRHGHPALRAPLTLERFLDLDQVALSPNSPGFHTLIDVELERRGLKRRVKMSLAHFTTLPFVISQTDFIAMFPRRLLKRFQGIGPFEVVESPFPFEPFTTSLAWHPRYHQDESHRWLRELIVRAAGAIEQTD